MFRFILSLQCSKWVCKRINCTRKTAQNWTLNWALKVWQDFCHVCITEIPRPVQTHVNLISLSNHNLIHCSE